MSQIVVNVTSDRGPTACKIQTEVSNLQRKDSGDLVAGSPGVGFPVQVLYSTIEVGGHFSCLSSISISNVGDICQLLNMLWRALA